jgi:hypothetical protein
MAWGMNSRPAGGRSSETWSHPIDMNINNKLILSKNGSLELTSGKFTSLSNVLIQKGKFALLPQISKSISNIYFRSAVEYFCYNFMYSVYLFYFICTLFALLKSKVASTER